MIQIFSTVILTLNYEFYSILANINQTVDPNTDEAVAIMILVHSRMAG